MAGAFGDVQTTKVGVAGMVLQPNEQGQSPWIQNLHMDTDGSFRPRYGLRLLRDFSGYRICGLAAAYQAKSTIQKHYIYVVNENSRLYAEDINGIGAASAVDMSALISTGSWANEQKNGVFAVGTPTNPTSTERRVVFSFPKLSDYSDAQLYDQTGAKVNDGTDLTGVPFAHGNTMCAIQKSTIYWSTYGDAYDYPTSNYTYLPPEIGEGVGGCYWQEDVSYIWGTQGVALMQGSPLEQSLRFRVLTAPSIAGGSAACIAKCRDRLFYIAPGPAIYLVGGGLARVDNPVNVNLRAGGDISNFQAFYDPLVDALCVAPYVSGGPNYTYLFNVSENKWMGVYEFATNTKSICKAANAGPLSSSDTVYRNAAPYSAVVVAVGDLLSYYDPSLYTDETASTVFTSFTCALESQPEGADAMPYLDKRLLGVYVDGTGEWTVKIKTRSGGGSYTTTTVGTVTAPGWVHATQDLTSYQERIIRCEASSGSTLRIKSMTIKEMVLGG